MISDKTARNLRAIRDTPGMRPDAFARKVYPESYQRLGQCGPNGVARGVGARQAAGSVFARLDRAGLIRRRFSAPGRGPQAYVTDAGRAALAEFEAAR